MFRVHILTFEGIRVFAKDLEVYSVVYCYDGYDYIVVRSSDGDHKFQKYEDGELPLFSEEVSTTEPHVPCPSLPEEVKTAAPVALVAVSPSVKKKIMLKKKPEEIVPVVVTVAQEEVPKEKEKTLSNYHVFIKEFLKKNTDIPWNERMKSANDAWKIHKATMATQS